MKVMENPKSLPWLARKAGVSDRRVDTLWNKALAMADANTQVAPSRRMAEAMQHLLRMLDRPCSCCGLTAG